MPTHTHIHITPHTRITHRHHTHTHTWHIPHTTLPPTHTHDTHLYTPHTRHAQNTHATAFRSRRSLVVSVLFTRTPSPPHQPGGGSHQAQQWCGWVGRWDHFQWSANGDKTQPAPYEGQAGWKRRRSIPSSCLNHNPTGPGPVTPQPNRSWPSYTTTQQVLAQLHHNPTGPGPVTSQPNKSGPRYITTQQVLAPVTSQPNRCWPPLHHNPTSPGPRYITNQQVLAALHHKPTSLAPVTSQPNKSWPPLHHNPTSPGRATSNGRRWSTVHFQSAGTPASNAWQWTTPLQINNVLRCLCQGFEGRPATASTPFPNVDQTSFQPQKVIQGRQTHVKKLSNMHL